MLWLCDWQLPGYRLSWGHCWVFSRLDEWFSPILISGGFREQRPSIPQGKESRAIGSGYTTSLYHCPNCNKDGGQFSLCIDLTHVLLFSLIIVIITAGLTRWICSLDFDVIYASHAEDVYVEVYLFISILRTMFKFNYFVGFLILTLCISTSWSFWSIHGLTQTLTYTKESPDGTSPVDSNDPDRVIDPQPPDEYGGEPREGGPDTARHQGLPRPADGAHCCRKTRRVQTTWRLTCTHIVTFGRTTPGAERGVQKGGTAYGNRPKIPLKKSGGGRPHAP